MIDILGLEIKLLVSILYMFMSLKVRRMADETGLDFSDQIGALERKYQLVSSSVLDFLFHVKLIFSRNRNFNGNKITSKMLVSDRPVKANED